MKKPALLLLTLLMATPGRLFAESEATPSTDTLSTETARWQVPKTGLYIGLVVPRTSVGGDFDGNRMYVGPDFILAVPEIEDSWGIGVRGGVKSRIRRDTAIGVEGSLLTSKHDTTWAGISGNARYVSFNLDGKFYAQARERFQPFLQLGMSLPQIEVEDGFMRLGEVDDATYSGIGLHAGLGMEFYFNPQWTLTAAALLQRQTYNSVEYKDNNSRLDDELVATDLNIQIATNIYFKTWN